MFRSLLTIAILLMLAPLGHCDDPRNDEIAIDQVVEDAPAEAAPEQEAPKEAVKQDAAKEDVKQDAAKEEVKQDDAKDEKPAEKKRQRKRGGELRNVGNVMRALIRAAIPEPVAGVEALVAPANENEAQIKQMAEQFTEQLRPMLLTELRIIRLSCLLAPTARPKIRAAGEAALKDAAREMAEFQFNRPGAMADGRSNIRAALADALAGALKESLSPAELAAYRAEAAHRADRVREAAILTVVSHLDGIVFLKEQQRIQISEAISENWQSEWESWLMLPQYGNQYFPEGAAPFIAPALNEEQQEVWRGLQKIDFGFQVFNDGGPVQDDDDWWNGAADPQPGNPNQSTGKAD